MRLLFRHGHVNAIPHVPAAGRVFTDLTYASGFILERIFQSVSGELFCMVGHLGLVTQPSTLPFQPRAMSACLGRGKNPPSDNRCIDYKLKIIHPIAQ